MKCFGVLAGLLLALSGCQSETATEGAPPQEPQPTVFDPLVDTLDRAQSVQQTIDARAAEQRRAIEEAEQR